MSINSFKDAEAVLSGYVPSSKDSKKPYTLDRMRQIMMLLDNPQNNYKSIHIAGTSGKTSTAYYIASLIKLSGKKVGLTVSPHIASVSERAQIDMEPLSEADYCKELSTFIQIIEENTIKPSYFELLVAFAFWEFDRQSVDYAVIEVGLGGLLDGTNVIDRQDKVSVITDIGYDHVNKLGSSLDAIAEQKAGIINEKSDVFYLSQASEVAEVFSKIAEEKQARTHCIDNKTLPSYLDFLPLFQQRNFLLAKTVYRYICERDKLADLSDSDIENASRTLIPGRMEIFSIGDKTVILDGAHNKQKLHALVSSLLDKYPNLKTSILFSLSSNQTGVVDELVPICDFIILTTFKNYQDEKKSLPKTQAVADQFHEKKVDYEIEINPNVALKKLLARPERILVITGSFYLLNALRPLILKI